MLPLLLDNKHYIISGACLCVAFIAMSIALVLFIKGRQVVNDSTDIPLILSREDIHSIITALVEYNNLVLIRDFITESDAHNAFTTNFHDLVLLHVLKTKTSKYIENVDKKNYHRFLAENYHQILSEAIRLEELRQLALVGQGGETIPVRFITTNISRRRSCSNLTDQGNIDGNVIEFPEGYNHAGGDPSSALYSVNNGQPLGDKSMA